MKIKFSNNNKLLVTVLTMGLMLGCFIQPSSISASTVGQELEIDTKLGLLERPWKINLIRIATRDYLRNQARAKTGLHTTLDRTTPALNTAKSTGGGSNDATIDYGNPSASSPESGDGGQVEYTITITPPTTESPPSTPTGFGTD